MVIDVGSALLGAAGINVVGSLLGGSLANRSSEKLFDANAALQKEMAQHGVRWRVADAQAAGVHPVYALGAALPQFSPVTVNTDAMGEAVSSAARSVGEGVAGFASARERKEWEMNRRTEVADQLWMNRELGLAQIAEHEALAAESRSRTLKNVLDINKERFSMGGDPLMQDAQEVVPEVFRGSKTPGMATDRRDKAWKPFDMGGWTMDWPSAKEAGLAQAMDGVEGLGPMMVVMQHNLKKYGVAWARQFGAWALKAPGLGVQVYRKFRELMRSR